MFFNNESERSFKWNYGTELVTPIFENGRTDPRVRDNPAFSRFQIRPQTEKSKITRQRAALHLSVFFELEITAAVK